jgi:hypothetical protein
MRIDVTGTRDDNQTHPVEKYGRDSKIGSKRRHTSNMQLQRIAKLIMKIGFRRC